MYFTSCALHFLLQLRSNLRSQTTTFWQVVGDQSKLEQNYNDRSFESLRNTVPAQLQDSDSDNRCLNLFKQLQRCAAYDYQTWRSLSPKKRCWSVPEDTKTYNATIQHTLIRTSVCKRTATCARIQYCSANIFHVSKHVEAVKNHYKTEAWDWH